MTRARKVSDVHELIYRGTLFRSRLEVKWAIFFHEMDIKAAYNAKWTDIRSGKAYSHTFHLQRARYPAQVIADADFTRNSDLFSVKIKAFSPYSEFVKRSDFNKLILLCGSPTFQSYMVLSAKDTSDADHAAVGLYLEHDDEDEDDSVTISTAPDTSTRGPDLFAEFLSFDFYSKALAQECGQQMGNRLPLIRSPKDYTKESKFSYRYIRAVSLALNERRRAERSILPPAPHVVRPQQLPIPLRTRFEVLRRDRFTCVYCGKSPAVTAGLELEIDHLIPVSKGGTNQEENLVTACKLCNLGKGNQLIDNEAGLSSSSTPDLVPVTEPSVLEGHP